MAAPASALECYSLVITGKVIITLEMGPGYQKAKNTIGPDLKSFLGMRLSSLNSNIDHQFPGHFWIITQISKMIQLAQIRSGGSTDPKISRSLALRRSLMHLQIWLFSKILDVLLEGQSGLSKTGWIIKQLYKFSSMQAQ